MGVAFGRKNLVDKDATTRSQVFVNAVQRFLCLGVGITQPVGHILMAKACSRNLLHHLDIVEYVAVGLAPDRA